MLGASDYLERVCDEIRYDRIFVEQLKNLATAGDVLLAISESGNSPNILKAVEWANRQGLITVGITGFGGGKLRTLAQHSLYAAGDDMGIAESLHQVVFHWIIDNLCRRISGPVAVLARSARSPDSSSPPAARGARPGRRGFFETRASQSHSPAVSCAEVCRRPLGLPSTPTCGLIVQRRER